MSTENLSIENQFPSYRCGNYFGEKWDSAFCDSGDRVTLPLGEACVNCNSFIKPGDQGIFTELLTSRMGPRPVPVHRECMLRAVVGGIGHLLNHNYWCRIKGDPDGGKTYRQSALEVWEWTQKSNQTISA